MNGIGIIGRRDLIRIAILAWVLIGAYYGSVQVTLFLIESRTPPYGPIAQYVFLRSLSWIFLTWLVVTLIDRQPAVRMTLRGAILGVVPGVTAAAVMDVAAGAGISTLMQPGRSFPEIFVSQLSDGFHGSLFGVFIIVTATHGIRFHQAHAEVRIRDARLEQALAQARLQALRSHMQPHFLFNTLNSISVLVRTDPASAEDMISGLGDLLRTAMRADDAETIPLADEMRLVSQYLEIQQIRYSDRLRSDIHAEDEALKCFVPRFLLQPLVENAIKHSVEQLDTPAAVSVHASIRERRLIMEITNDAPPDTTSFETPQGLGLRATKERLTLIYGDTYEFGMTHAEGRVTATIGLPLRGIDIHRSP